MPSLLAWTSQCQTIYGWVPIQPFQPKQAIFRTGFDFNVFFSGVLEFQLVRSLITHATEDSIDFIHNWAASCEKGRVTYFVHF